MAFQPTFVLVHGAFHGGWCWDLVAEPLRQLGYRVFTPTLTGLAERQHLLSPAVDLDLWVGDITTLIEHEHLTDVILVGHSFAGHVITGVAGRCARRLRHLVFLDGGPAEPGVPVAASLPPPVWAARMATAFERCGVRCFHAPPAGYFGIDDPGLAAWLESRLTPMPVAAYTTSLALREPLGTGYPVSFIHCTAPALEIAAQAAEQARARGWTMIEIPTGHDAMLTAPDAVVAILGAIAAGATPACRPLS
jgi:pimeloyl-ACP methyl ester carboxylesterase